MQTWWCSNWRIAALIPVSKRSWSVVGVGAEATTRKSNLMMKICCLRTHTTYPRFNNSRQRIRTRAMSINWFFHRPRLQRICLPKQSCHLRKISESCHQPKNLNFFKPPRASLTFLGPRLACLSWTKTQWQWKQPLVNQLRLLIHSPGTPLQRVTTKRRIKMASRGSMKAAPYCRHRTRRTIIKSI